MDEALKPEGILETQKAEAEIKKAKWEADQKIQEEAMTVTDLEGLVRATQGQIRAEVDGFSYPYNLTGDCGDRPKGCGGLGWNVASQLASEELQRRTDLLVKAYKEYVEAAKEMAKIKPDAVVRDDRGVVITNGYSDAGWKKFISAKEKVEKLTKAINNALQRADFSGLE